MQDIKDYIEKYSAILPMSQSLSIPDAEKRAADFLVVQAQIANWKHLLTQEKIKLTTLQSATYSELLSRCTGKTVTENKLTVEAAPEYAKVREDLEALENDISYLKAYNEVFLNAHLFYRMLAKSEL